MGEIEKNERLGIGYCRISDQGQEVEHGSLDAQVNSIKRFVINLSERTGVKYKLLELFVEIRSGKREALKLRQEYHKICKLVERGAIDFVVIEKLDRLGRWEEENTRFLELCSASNIQVYTVESGLPINLQDKTSRMAYKFQNIFCEEYTLDLSEKKKKKIREAMVGAGKDNGTRPVLGLDAHPSKPGFYVVNKKELVMLISIFEDFASHGFLTTTVEYCHNRGYRTKVVYTARKIVKGLWVEPVPKGGEILDLKSLRALLTNPKYLGHNSFLDDWGQFPKLQDKHSNVTWHYPHGNLIPEKLFFRVQELLQSNREKHCKTGKKRVYYLSGVLVTEDGKSFNGRAYKSGSNLYYGNDDKKLLLPKEPLEDLVISRVKELAEKSGILDPILERLLKSKDGRTISIETELTEAKEKEKELSKSISTHEGRELEKLTSSLVQAGKDGVGDVVQKIMEAWSKRSEGLKSDLLNIELRVSELEEKKRLIGKRLRRDILRDYLSLWHIKIADEKHELKKKRLIQSLIPKIRVLPFNRLELTINPLLESGVTYASKKYALEKSGGRDGT